MLRYIVQDCLDGRFAIEVLIHYEPRIELLLALKVRVVPRGNSEIFRKERLPTLKLYILCAQLQQRAVSAEEAGLRIEHASLAATHTYNVSYSTLTVVIAMNQTKKSKQNHWPQLTLSD